MVVNLISHINERAVSHDNNGLFHIINNQNGRNLIVGNTKDFLLGDNIRREYELKDEIESEFKILFENTLLNSLKNEFSIKKKNSDLISRISDEQLQSYASDIANSRSKGSSINKDSFITYIAELVTEDLEEYDESKLNFLVSNLVTDNSISLKILELSNENLLQNNEVKKVEQNSEAIKLLRKFPNVQECVVCDGEICVEEKLDNKIQHKERIFNVMQPQTKGILEDLLKLAENDDPYEMKNTMLQAIDEGNFNLIEELKAELQSYLSIFNAKLKNLFKNTLTTTNLVNNVDEFNTLIQARPQLSDEDILFIEHIVNENIEKTIELERDENNTLRLVLDGEEFLNRDRQKLKLSNGEQNFISLAFELLKAKNVDNEIIILDDPISSFDSIFKNKIAFSIIKFLLNKKQIVLTHNLELIRLLEHQQQNCFKLYIFNNTLGEANGFFKLSNEEINQLLYIHKLIDFFRESVMDEIESERQFLMSMVPFMRGYSQITFNQDAKSRLTQLMHGYNDITHNVTAIYRNLFGDGVAFNEDHIISADDIVSEDMGALSLFKEDSHYKLLEKTLKHTLTYLNLRLNVEKTLVEKFNINTNRYEMLSQIIFAAFRTGDDTTIRRRVFLASKKTLLNEFNHFEGNMNIFQPAIDITDTALYQERLSIEEFLSDL